MIGLKEEFKSMLHDLLGHEALQLIEALDRPPVISIRTNRRKPGAEFPDSEAVPWCKRGIYLSKRPEFIMDPMLHAGAYYVQEASSMIYETLTEKILAILKQAHPASDFFRVLDLCAAPGGKTTAIINALPDGSMVVANEFSAKRAGILRENLEKWCSVNSTIDLDDANLQVKVTNCDASFFAGKEEFDIVVVDAPCSGEGMMRKEEMARSQWSKDLVMQCSSLQREILKNAVTALKPGGFLFYSTCTFNRLENEENAEFIAEDLKLVPFDPCFPGEWGISRGINSELPVYRFMPHKTRGEGLFLAAFRKPGEWQPSRPVNISNTSATYPKVEVNRDTALAYLRRESIILPPDTPKGMVTITYNGLALGPAKNIGSRANNLYPKNRRILKR